MHFKVVYKHKENPKDVLECRLYAYNEEDAKEKSIVKWQNFLVWTDDHEFYSIKDITERGF